MDETIVKNLGEPNIKLAGLQIWIHGRQFPDAQDVWDGNWLRVTAHCGAAGADVWASGSFIHLGEIDNWHSQLRPLYETLEGKAELACMEPILNVILKGEGGQITMQVSLTPDHIDQQHLFQFHIEQSYLLPVLKQCSAVLDQYPVRAKPE